VTSKTLKGIYRLKADGGAFIKEVLRELPEATPHEIKVMLAEMILRAYLRGREDEARSAELSVGRKELS
jgi:hypothetical protein